MKLFLTWLLGVPLLVTTMVMAQSMLVQNRDIAGSAVPHSQQCSGHGDLHGVTSAVPKQGNRISCNELAVQ